MRFSIRGVVVTLSICKQNQELKSKLLITGASSFIGGFLVEEALRNGFEVYAGVRKTSNRQYLQHKDINCIELDLSSQEMLEYKMKEIWQKNGGLDFIIHNAGVTYAKKREDFYCGNFQCTKNLAEALIKTQMPVKKFVLVSSLAAYGPGEDMNFKPIGVSDHKNPASTYGKSKLRAEEYLSSLSGLPYLIINSTAVYGPRDRDFLRFIDLINKGFEPYIGRNKQMISLIYVKDLARAIVRLLSLSVVNRSYIASDGFDYNKEELGNISRKILNKKTFKVKIPRLPLQIVASAVDAMCNSFGSLPFLNKEKINEISSANWLCDSEELWNDINDKPEFNLENGVLETINWYKENKWI
jgi:nucleoside-diphosphate-sugar epimerase